MSYVLAAYGITIAVLVVYGVSLHRERALQVDEDRRDR